MHINRNMSAVITNNQLLRTENRLAASMERLSSGFKINHASDNPAGIAISNKMRAQIDALDQAEANASDGVSVPLCNGIRHCDGLRISRSWLDLRLFIGSTGMLAG